MPKKSKNHKKRLHIQKIPVNEVSNELLEDIWELFSSNYKDVLKDKFIEDLLEKNYIFCGFDKEINKLGGFTTLKIYSKKINNKKVWIYFSGDTMFKKEYWGQKVLHKSVGLHLLQHRLKYPFQPFFWFLVVMGYRTYLTMAKNTAYYWPRYDRETPAYIKNTIDFLALDRFGDFYDSNNGLIAPHVGSGNLAKHVAPITDDLRRTIPEVNFLLQHNPNYDKGYELACLGKLDILFFAKIWFKSLKAQLKKLSGH